MVYLNNQHNFIQPDFNERPGFNKKRLGVILLIFFLLAVGYFSFRLGSKSNTIEVRNESVSFWQKVASILSFTSEPVDPDYIMPSQEPNRFDVLIMGLRGEDDPDASDGGPLLTDSMMVLGYDKTTKKASMISIPRDLYVKINKNKKDKINTAYENGGLDYVKELVSKITGVYIDKAVVLDFSSFEKIIDQVGGIDIVLVQPFEEKRQWGYEFSLPAGPNHLDGKNALYYARSRFSSSDFDRSRRQQEVMFALKDKLTHLNFWSDPLKTISVLNSIRSNIKTDINIWNTKELLDLAREADTSDKIKKYVMATDNLLYESRVNGSYMLLPKGDNFTQIKQLFQDILN
ncbi:MAG: LCP family protein [Candidatus Yanofskybacteria bacterium]|nr:LCP family protein [Candidatus Yanofskybacteria bacterium]